MREIWEEYRGIGGYICPSVRIPLFSIPQISGRDSEFCRPFYFFYIVSLDVFSKLQFYSKPNQFKYRLKLKPSSLVKVNMLSSEVPLSPLAWRQKIKLHNLQVLSLSLSHVFDASWIHFFFVSHPPPPFFVQFNAKNFQIWADFRSEYCVKKKCDVMKVIGLNPYLKSMCSNTSGLRLW